MQNMRDNSVFHLFGYEANLDNNKSYHNHNIIYHNYALHYFLFFFVIEWNKINLPTSFVDLQPLQGSLGIHL